VSYQAEPSVLKKFLPHSLSGMVISAVTIAVIVTELLVLVPSVFYWQESAKQETVERIKKNWQSAIDTRTFPDTQELEAIALRFIDLNFIKGATFYNASGEELTTVGERPFLNLSMSRVNNQKTYESQNTEAFDIHIDPTEIGAAQHIIVRLDTAPMKKNINGRLLNMFLAVLAVVLSSATAILIIIYQFIVKPINTIHSAVKKVSDNPDLADQAMIKSSARNELGELARALDQLFHALSIVHQEELAALEKASEQTNIGILQYDKEGVLLSANPAARAMLNIGAETDLKSFERNIFLLNHENNSELMGIKDLAEHNDFASPCALKVRDGLLSCFISAVTIKNNKDEVMRYVANIVDISGPMMKVASLKGKNDKLQRSLNQQHIKEQELKQLLESCLCLLAGPNSARKAEDFLPDRIVNDWYEEAKAAHLVSGQLEYNVLPWLYGDQSHIRNIFRQAMLLIYTRSVKARPTFYVKAEELPDKKVKFIILDISNKRLGGGAKRSKSIDYKLPLAALQKTLALEQGQLINFKDDLGESMISFTLQSSEKNKKRQKRAS
jgi:PAS domain-containing protein